MTRAAIMMALGATLALAFAAPEQASAQGNVGGTIGKRNRAVIGDTTAPAPSKRKPAAKPRASRTRDTTDTPAGPDVSGGIVGSWDWEASCSDGMFKGEWRGGMNLREISPGSFVGEFTKGHFGSVVGRVNGRSVSFTRDMAGIVQQRWTGSMTPGGKPRMQGTYTAPGASGCRFSATKI